MTIKLWLLSIILSAIAPHIMPKCQSKNPKSEPGDNRDYIPGKYFENTME